MHLHRAGGGGGALEGHVGECTPRLGRAPRAQICAPCAPSTPTTGPLNGPSGGLGGGRASLGIRRQGTRLTLSRSRARGSGFRRHDGSGLQPTAGPLFAAARPGPRGARNSSTSGGNAYRYMCFSGQAAGRGRGKRKRPTQREAPLLNWLGASDNGSMNTRGQARARAWRRPGPSLVPFATHGQVTPSCG